MSKSPRRLTGINQRHVVGTEEGLLATMWGIITLLTLAVAGPTAILIVEAAPIATVDLGAVEMLSRDSVSRMQTLNLEQVNTPPTPHPVALRAHWNPNYSFKYFSSSTERDS